MVFLFGGFAYNSPMQFELTAMVTDQIIFFMENRHGEFLLDTREGIVLSTDDAEFVDCDEAGDGDRCISLPDWGPSEGFRLMERFAAGLRGAPVRQELSAALDRGRGVFRSFKDTLTRHPETEKLWFAFKDREMKRVVVQWYNALRETWGLEMIGEEPEDTTGLVLEDFLFREGTAADLAAAEELHRYCLCECSNESGEGETPDAGTAEIVAGMGEWVFPGEISVAAETAGGEFAGYICGSRLPNNIFHVCALEVKAEYRGLGLGKTLIARLLEQTDSRKISQVIIDLPAGREHFLRTLLREYFKPRIQRFCRMGPV